jgi:hypothetical protein
MSVSHGVLSRKRKRSKSRSWCSFHKNVNVETISQLLDCYLPESESIWPVSPCNENLACMS